MVTASYHTTDASTGLWLWRHPRPAGAVGRCIGRTDLPVDRRRAKRLAHRIRGFQRRHGLPRVVWSSPLRRCADVGRWLARWGWVHHVDAALLELDFGHWDGLPWSQIAWAEVAAWEADLAHHAPGGGEPLDALLQRCAQWLAAVPPQTRLLVAHAGFINACRLLLLDRGSADPEAPGCWRPPVDARTLWPLRSADWPPAAGYGQRLGWVAAAAGATADC